MSQSALDEGTQGAPQVRRPLLGSDEQLVGQIDRRLQVGKALHYRRGDRLVLGHSRLELLRRLQEAHPALRDLADAARQLDQYYIPTRGPNGLPGGIPAEAFTERQATEALAFASQLIGAAQVGLGGSAS